MINFPTASFTGEIFRPSLDHPEFMWDGGAWVLLAGPGGIPHAGFRNVIINGQFLISQRNTSGYGTGSSVAYTYDRWRAVAQGYGTNFASFRGYHSQSDQHLYNISPYFYRCICATTSAANGDVLYIQTSIENVRTFAGQPVTISFWATAQNAGRLMSIEVYRGYGTGGSPSAGESVYSNKITLTTSWVKYVRTFTMPDLTGKTIGSNGDDYLILYFWFAAGSDYNSRTQSLGHQTVGEFDISQVQMEPGIYATPFEQRLYDTELSMCRRYYETNYPYTNYLMLPCPAAGGFGQYFPMQYKTAKRVIPSVTESFTSPANFGSNSIAQVYVNGHVTFMAGANAGNAAAFYQWFSNAEMF